MTKIEELTDSLFNQEEDLLLAFRVMINDISKEEAIEKGYKLPFEFIYQSWYSSVLLLLRTVFPERLEEFQNCYLPQKNRKELSILNYTISDSIQGLYNISRNVKLSSATNLLQTQFSILYSLKIIIDEKIIKIKDCFKYEVFDEEIDSAKYLLKNGFLRSAGAICGVIIEKHLSLICDRHNLSLIKKNSTINDYKEILKNASIIELSQARHIEYMATLRNLCDHDKKQEPTKEQIEDLIQGTEKIIKTLD